LEKLWAKIDSQASVTSPRPRDRQITYLLTMPESEETMMDDTILKSGSDALLVGVPFVLCLLFFMFRLDQLIFRSRKSSGQRPPSGIDEAGETIFTDPDGTVVSGPERRR
jgi:hypothetical protein